MEKCSVFSSCDKLCCLCLSRGAADVQLPLIPNNQAINPAELGARCCQLNQGFSWDCVTYPDEAQFVHLIIQGHLYKFGACRRLTLFPLYCLLCPLNRTLT